MAPNGWETAIRRLTAILVAAYVLLVIRDFAHYIDHYPYLSFDDSLATVMNSIATTGRFGDFGYPVHNPYDVPRHTAFFTYGPWYFYLGAALIWTFGFSFTMLRWIHPGVLLFATGLACWWLGRERGAAAGIFAIGIFYCLDTVQWPMVRPDIMVSFFAAAFLVSAGIGMLGDRAMPWLIAGLCSACAAFSHLASISLVGSCAMLFVSWAWPRRANRRAVLTAFVCVSAGVLGAALMFYGSFGFKVKEQLEVVFAYRALTAARLQGQMPLGFGSIFRQHLYNAFGYLRPAARGVVIAGIALGTGVALASFRLEPRLRALARAYLLPPLVSLALYQLSLGFYSNFHTGYAILSQTLAFWAAASILNVVVQIVSATRPLAGRTLSISTAIVVSCVAVVLSAQKLEAVSDRGRVATRWASMSEYVEHLIDGLPRGFHGWGAYSFVLQLPDRAEVIALDVALRIAASKPLPGRLAVAPEYLVWGWIENRVNWVPATARVDNQLEKLDLLFPGSRFTIARLVAADPYGVTRLYERTTAPAAGQPPLPSVAAWEPSTDQWVETLSPSMAMLWPAAASLCYDLQYNGEKRERCATRTVGASLPPGWYLFRVGVKTAAGPADRMVAVSATPRLDLLLGDLPPAGDEVFYTPHDEYVDLLHRHPGGTAYLGMFDTSAGAAITGVEVRPLAPATDFSEDRDRLSLMPLPSAAAWAPDATNGVHAAPVPEGLRVEGNASANGYQMVSPTVPVTPGAAIALEVRLDVERGSVCVGVLTENQSAWVLPPTPIAPLYRFSSGTNKGLHVVVANCRNAGAPEEKSLFVIRGAGMGSRPAFFVDQLMDGWVRKSSLELPR